MKNKNVIASERSDEIVRPRDSSYVALFDAQIRDVFKDALKTTLRNPSLAPFFARTLTGQRRAARVRRQWEEKGVHVPPLLIASITGRCNLKCKGCYAQSQRWAAVKELTMERWHEIIAEARDLGISIVMIAGGEPLTRPEILDVTRDFPGVIFPLFSNGLLFDDKLGQELGRQRHVIPIVSLEGFELETDDRRGKGVYGLVQQVIGHLEGKDIFFGVSLTVSRRNFPVLTSEEFFLTLREAGSRLFIYVEYTPVEEGTEELVLTLTQRAELQKRTLDLNARYGSIVIGFPGDEEQYGGCLAAGRGFVHVGPDGSLEPCPFAPYSDANLGEMTLRQALGSNLMAAIRANHDRLTETSGGCALWQNREWVKSLIGGR
jgi:MoaA/NifB/PqqE/SkfB family radical SAM enzyme